MQLYNLHIDIGFHRRDVPYYTDGNGNYYVLIRFSEDDPLIYRFTIDSEQGGLIIHESFNVSDVEFLNMDYVPI